jgi:hypothetical protein
MSEDLSAPGRELFPEYPGIAGMYEEEVRGLTGEQLDLHRPEKSWGLWSIREQISHTAWAHYRWFLDNWGQVLFGDKFPRENSLTDNGSADRRMNPERFHEIPDLLGALKDATALAWEILENETLGSLRGKVQTRQIEGNHQWPSGDGLMAWTMIVTMKAHPAGFRQDETDPNLFHYDLEYTFRHVLWEAYATYEPCRPTKKRWAFPSGWTFLRWDTKNSLNGNSSREKGAIRRFVAFHPREQANGIFFHQKKVVIALRHKTFLASMIKKRKQRIEIGPHVQQADRLFDEPEIDPGNHLHCFFHRSKTARQNDKSIGKFGHKSLALVHGFDDAQLTQPMVGHFEIHYPPGNDADDLPSPGKRRIGEHSHETDIPAAVHQPDSLFRQNFPQLFGGVDVDFSIAPAGACKYTNLFHYSALSN